ncbi:hypothetical protein OIU84_019474 [Salix udensis]|uniref:Uncharacterized protein n=1 Tax=Salix udensis TaxID=889485 RepID=A0AAD6PJG9_9ROSI|nr:hypothetical protein OIU84_019474 [Salix udensis]
MPPSPQPKQINCDRSHRFYDLCTINGPAVLDPVSSTLYLSDPIISSATVEKIRPYPRKWEKAGDGRNTGVHSDFKLKKPSMSKHGTNFRQSYSVRKYGDLLHTYSKHPIIIPENETSTHCFPSATLGLISHGSMTINPKLMPNSQALTHFRAFLDKAYNHGQNHPWKFNSPKPRPRLVLATRNGGVGTCDFKPKPSETFS